MPPIPPTLFRDVLSRFATGITIVSVRDSSGADHGMTVSAFTSVSLTPPLVLVCIGHDATIAGAVSQADRFGVSVLASDQRALSARFAESRSNRFGGVPVARGATGVALLPGALAHLECRVVARHEAGDHTVLVGEVVHAQAFEGEPLIHLRGDYGGGPLSLTPHSGGSHGSRSR